MQSLREKLFGAYVPLREKLSKAMDFAKEVPGALKEVYAKPEEPKPQVGPKDTPVLKPGMFEDVTKNDIKVDAGTLVAPKSAVTLDPDEEPSATPIQPPEPSKAFLEVKDRGVQVDKEHIEKTLKPMLYSEVASFLDRPREKVELEIRTVVNTVLNRMKGWGGSLEEIVTQPKQYQGVGSKKYEAFGTTTDETEKKQIALINEVVDTIVQEIENGSFIDNVAGAVFYGHAKDGTIRAYDTWEQYEEAIRAGKIK
jgi:hypothetical protein